MTSDELAKAVGEIVQEAQSRITGIGAEQYAQNDTQKFERMTLPALLVYMEEELLDQINYSAMNLIRVRSLKAALEDRMEGIADMVRNDLAFAALDYITKILDDFNREG